MDRSNDYETMLIELERVSHLLTLMFEEIDESPRTVNKQNLWKASLYCKRADILEALVNSVYTLVEEQRNALQKWIDEKYKYEESI